MDLGILGGGGDPRGSLDGGLLYIRWNGNGLVFVLDVI